MIRPCFLVIDRDYPGTISTRKLVIETAKFNVLTAYTPKEAVATLRQFPKVNGIVIDAEVDGVSCADLVSELKGITPDIPIIVTSGRGYIECGDVHHHLENYDPGRLLDILRSLFPKESEGLVQHEKSLPRD